MREVGETQNDCSSSHFYLKQQLYGGGGLETLTEVENEDEFNKGSSPTNDTDSCGGTNCGSGSSNGSSSGDEIVISRSRVNSHRSFENMLLREDDGCTADVDYDYEDEDRDEVGSNGMKYFGHSSLPSSLNTICNSNAQRPNPQHYYLDDTVTKCQSCSKFLRLKETKISTLEKTIQQLKDELKEYRDQNELLEFRLLEIQEFGPNSNESQEEFGRAGNESKPVEELIETNDRDNRKRSNCNRKSLEYGPEVTSEEVMIQSEYQNNHANISESRSASCSDCSESLSFQESGIFDSQFNEDSCPPPHSSSSSDTSTELAILSSQIEGLILRLSSSEYTSSNNESGPSQEKCDETKCYKRVAKCRTTVLNGGSRMKGKDLKDSSISLELQSCRKQVHELEKRLTPYLNNTYINSLEDKLSGLVEENRRLEEERCEMEEAENDSRNQCQRLDEMLRQVRDRNIILQRELSREKAFVEQLSFQMEEIQESHNQTISQLNRLESVLQNYEQRNFELEESNIELKSCTKFLMEFLPVFQLATYLRSLRRPNEGTTSDHQNLCDIQKRNLVTLVRRRQFAQPSLCGPGTCSTPQLGQTLPELPSSSTTSIAQPTKVTNQQNEIPTFRKTCSSKSTQTMHLACYEDKSDGPMITLVEQSNQQFNERNSVMARMRERSESQRGELERNINEYRKVSQMEKIEVIEKYERKLAVMQQETNDQIEHSRRELANLKESWDILVKELEQACISLNLIVHTPNASCVEIAGAKTQIPQEPQVDNSKCQKSVAQSSMVNIETGNAKSFSTKITTTNKIKGGSLVANRIQSLFPNEWRASVESCDNISSTTKSEAISHKPPIKPKPKSNNIPLCTNASTKELIQNLVCHFNELKEKFENRESALLSQIEQLIQQQKILPRQETTRIHHVSQAQSINRQLDEQESSRVLQLLGEKERLESILSDQEKVWSKLKNVEEENEKLATELSNTTRMLKRKLDASLSIQTDLQNKIEELELSECSSKEELSKRDAKVRKLGQEIQDLKEDCEFYHNKSCKLQTELDERVKEVIKFKNEAQQVSTKLKAHEQMLRDKEQALETTETMLESQISQLQAHLKTLQQELCDSECTNGMLREEILYLEQTLQTALEKNSRSEDEMKILACRIQEKAETLAELRRECCCNTLKEEQLNSLAANDLDVFAKNEGGLVGLAREIEDVKKVVQNCNQCSDAGFKLTEVLQQLNTLTLMLGGNQTSAAIYLDFDQKEHFLTRCESEEHITTSATIDSQQSHKNDLHTEQFVHELHSCQSVLAENKMLHSHLVQLSSELSLKDQEIDRLQKSITSLGVELSELEKEFLARKNDLKESHLNELLWWKLRCQEKNDLIHLLARRIAQLSFSDSNGYFMDGILKEIQQIRDENYSSKQHRIKVKSDDESSPQDCNSLLTFFNNERRRLTEMLSSCTDSDKQLTNSKSRPSSEVEPVDFRVLRRLSEDSILVSWTIPTTVSSGLVDGYEISVNGNIFLRIPKPNRFKAILFGLNMKEPLELCLRYTGGYDAVHESCITFIA